MLSEVRIYCDGSYFQTPKGVVATWAFVVKDKQTEKLLHRDRGEVKGELVSASIAELAAVEEALKWVVESGVHSAEILTDSNYIEAHMKKEFRGSTFKMLRELLEQAKQRGISVVIKRVSRDEVEVAHDYAKGERNKIMNERNYILTKVYIHCAIIHAPCGNNEDLISWGIVVYKKRWAKMRKEIYKDKGWKKVSRGAPLPEEVQEAITSAFNFVVSRGFEIINIMSYCRPYQSILMELFRKLEKEGVRVHFVSEAREIKAAIQLALDALQEAGAACGIPVELPRLCETHLPKLEHEKSQRSDRLILKQTQQQNMQATAKQGDKKYVFYHIFCNVAHTSLGRVNPPPFVITVWEYIVESTDYKEVHRDVGIAKIGEENDELGLYIAAREALKWVMKKGVNGLKLHIPNEYVVAALRNEKIWWYEEYEYEYEDEDEYEYEYGEIDPTPHPGSETYTVYNEVKSLIEKAKGENIKVKIKLVDYLASVETRWKAYYEFLELCRKQRKRGKQDIVVWINKLPSIFWDKVFIKQPLRGELKSIEKRSRLTLKEVKKYANLDTKRGIVYFWLREYVDAIAKQVGKSIEDFTTFSDLVNEVNTHLKQVWGLTLEEDKVGLYIAEQWAWEQLRVKGILPCYKRDEWHEISEAMSILKRLLWSNV